MCGMCTTQPHLVASSPEIYRTAIFVCKSKINNVVDKKKIVKNALEI